MFDLGLQVRLRQARAALGEGRLDEAFAIAVEKSVREHRAGQELLEDLVRPLLERAAENLREGRLAEALLDAERAIEAGGNRPEALRLREQIEEARRAEGAAKLRELELVASARRRLLAGSLRAGEELLEGAGSDSPEARRLKREIEDRERRAARAAARARDAVARGDVIGALACARELVAADPKGEGIPEVVAEVRRAAAQAIERALQEGKLTLAVSVFQELRAAGGGMVANELEEAVSFASEARAALRKGDLESTRERLEALGRRVPGAAWIREAIEAAEAAGRGLRALRVGPLGSPWEEDPVGPPEGPGKPPSAQDATVAYAFSPNEVRPMTPRKPEPSPTPLDSRFLLWVDGVGTYLVLSSDRVAIGREGSSFHPDVALLADAGGRRAEIVRADEDYFVVSMGEPILVGGKPTRRKLLATEDAIDLGPRCRIVFRLPTPLSATAVLSLQRGQRIHGDVRNVVLLKDHLVLGPKGKSHVEIGRGSEKIVLSREPRGLVCRAAEEIFLGTAAAGREALVPPGVRVQVGEVTFTVTDSGGRA